MYIPITSHRQGGTAVTTGKLYRLFTTRRGLHHHLPGRAAPGQKLAIGGCRQAIVLCKKGGELPAINRLRLGPRSRRLLFWSSIYGTYANFLGTLWAAVWGATGMMKVAAGGATGQPVHEGIVAFLLVSLSLAMLVVCGLLLRGLRWSPRSPPADPAR